MIPKQANRVFRFRSAGPRLVSYLGGPLSPLLKTHHTKPTWIWHLFKEAPKTSRLPLDMSLCAPYKPLSPTALNCDYQRLPIHRPKGPLRRTDVRRKGRPDHWRVARHRSRDNLAFRACWRIIDDRRAHAVGPGRNQGHDPARATFRTSAHLPSRRAGRQESGGGSCRHRGSLRSLGHPRGECCHSPSLVSACVSFFGTKPSVWY